MTYFSRRRGAFKNATLQNLIKIIMEYLLFRLITLILTDRVACKFQAKKLLLLSMLQDLSNVFYPDHKGKA